MKKIIITALAVMMLAGCNDPKIDASTEESMKSSIQEVRNSLDEADKPRFERAVQIVALSNVSLGEIMRAKQNNDDQFMQNKFKESLGGKSGQEVIALADEIEKKRQGQ